MPDPYRRPDSQLAALSDKQLVRMRTASIERSVQLRHPVPDLQSLQGAYVKNIVNLEDHAERMSLGSDIGEEIRKLREEQKLSDSRRASLYSNAAVEPEVKSPSRHPSISSYANSIVEVNSTARYGGYSPAAFVGSPIGSVQSGSWSQVSHGAMSRSISKGSRLGQLPNPEFDDEPFHPPLDGPSNQASVSAARTSIEDDEEDTRISRLKRVSTGRMLSGGSFTRLYNQIAQENGSAAHLAAVRIPSDTSFTNFYDQIAGEIREHLDMPANEGLRPDPGGSSLQPTPGTPGNGISRQPGAASSPPQEQDPIPPQPPRHLYILPQVESAAELDGFTVTSEMEKEKKSSEDVAEYPVSDSQRLPARSSSAASGDTFQQAQALFEDFDGAHYAGSVLGSSRVPSGNPSEVLNPDSDRTSILRNLDPPLMQAVPPPHDGMVFYPAPVPRMLNLPQRLSKVPSAAVHSKRRTQLLESMPIANRQCVAWMEQERTDSEGIRNVRMSRPTSQLPAQLRASFFFEQQTRREEVEIKDQSAMNTLEELLDASARAPVNAFTSHPITGAAGTAIYKKENGTRSSSSIQQNRKCVVALGDDPEKVVTKRRSSFFGLRRSSISSANALDDARKSPSRIRKRRSMTVSAVLDDSALTRGPDGEIAGHDRLGATTPVPRILNERGEQAELSDEKAIEADEHVDAEEDDAELVPEETELEQPYGPPTTLLAELQLRKAQQAQRGRTFGSFPKGMHSTLLELDAVAQLEKQKRQKSRVALAWEDPSLKQAEEAEGDDDDVPLGVLYGGKSKVVKARLAERGMADWDRPLGLLERRQMEDNEPLSRRRNRLLGINPNAAAINARQQSQVNIAEPDSESEHEGETLGQRLKRLKDKKVLTDAIGNVDDNRVSRAFSVDMLNALGVEPATEGNNRESSSSRQLGDQSSNVDEHRKSTPLLSPGAISPDIKRESFVPLSAAEMSKLADKRKSSSSLLGGEEVETPGEEEEETLGQRRARLQRETMARSRQGSQMTLDPETPMSTIRSVSNMVPLADPRMSAMFPNHPHVISVARPTLAQSSSMADLLNAYPSGKNDARKVSNDMLLSSLPQGSLLAQNENEKATRSSYIKMTNNQGMGFGNQRTPSGNSLMHPGYQVQTPYQGGLVGMSAYLPRQTIDSIYGNMSKPNVMMGMPGHHQPPMGLAIHGYAGASQPNLFQQPMMSNPNLMAGYENGGMAMPQHMLYPQRQSSYGMMTPHERMEEPVLDKRTRHRVDAWRQGVVPS